MAVLLLIFAAFIGVTDSGGRRSGSDSRPTACTESGTRSAFKKFVSAYDRGAIKELDRLFADEPAFQWYSSGAPGQRLGPEAMKRSSLLHYFRNRHMKGDRFRLVSIQFNDGTERNSNFVFQLERRVNGFRNGAWHRMIGKGAVSCFHDEPRFIVISLGGWLN